MSSVVESSVSSSATEVDDFVGEVPHSLPAQAVDCPSGQRADEDGTCKELPICEPGMIVGTCIPAPVAPASAREQTTKTTAWAIVKVIFGLSLLFVLAYLAGHPKVESLERTLGVTHVVTAGFPFVALGLIASSDAVGILSPTVIEHLNPLVNFGLGWLGFTIGLQLDMRHFDDLPSDTALLVVIEASIPFIVIAAMCGTLMIMFGGAINEATFVRDALILAAAGAMTAPIILNNDKFSNQAIAQGWKPGHGLDSLISQLDEIAGVIGLLFLAAYFRPDSAALWTLPGTAWVFVTVGLGVVLGIVMYLMLKSPSSNAEYLAILLGFVAFASGMASYLFLSAIVVCFIAGMLLTNFPGKIKDDLMPILSRLERPIYMTFLLMVGAYWQVGDWRGWALLPCFVVARIIGNWLGVLIGKRAEIHEDEADKSQLKIPILKEAYRSNMSQSMINKHEEHGHRALVAPLSALSIAIVVNVWVLYGRDITSQWIFTAVIGGAIITEVLVQVLSGSRATRAASDSGQVAATSVASTWRETTGVDHEKPVEKNNEEEPADASEEWKKKPATTEKEWADAGNDALDTDNPKTLNYESRFEDGASDTIDEGETEPEEDKTTPVEGDES